MDEIITHLNQSIADEVFSKEERKIFRELVSEKSLSKDQLSLLQTRIYELANERISDSNYRFILEWIRGVQGTLNAKEQEKPNVFFSPGNACRNAIITQIGNAIKRIRICIFTLSDDHISNAILLAHKKGVDVKIITDNDKTFDKGSDIERLVKSGISIKQDNTPDHMHHKFMVVDERSVLTGSYNWTLSAARVNHENIVLTSDEGIVKSFLDEFDKLWAGSSMFLMK